MIVMRASEAAREEGEIVATSVAVAREIFVVARDILVWLELAAEWFHLGFRCLWADWRALL